MIGVIRHKELAALYAKGDTKGVQQKQVKRLIQILNLCNSPAPCRKNNHLTSRAYFSIAETPHIFMTPRPPKSIPNWPEP
jgi:hypothetical protein